MDMVGALGPKILCLCSFHAAEKCAVRLPLDSNFTPDLSCQSYRLTHPGGRSVNSIGGQNSNVNSSNLQKYHGTHTQTKREREKF